MGFDGAGSNLLLLYVTGLSNLRKIKQLLPMCVLFSPTILLF